jgi:hypothetical protein
VALEEEVTEALDVLEYILTTEGRFTRRSDSRPALEAVAERLCLRPADLPGPYELGYEGGGWNASPLHLSHWLVLRTCGKT